MICKFCTYEWESRREMPKACPRCKRRFDYPSLQERIEMSKKIMEAIENGS